MRDEGCRVFQGLHWGIYKLVRKKNEKKKGVGISGLRL
jgi:hypothetical protein